MKRIEVLIGVFGMVLALYVFFNFKEAKSRFEDDRAIFLQEKVVLKKEIGLLKEKEASLSGKVAELENKLRLVSAAEVAQPFAAKRGKILTIDKNCNLIVANLGRRDGVNEKDRLKILKDGKEIAEATVIGIRSHTLAAFVDGVEYSYHVRSIEKGDEVLISE